MNDLKPQLNMLHDYLDGEFVKLESNHFDCFIIKPVEDGGYQRSPYDDIVHDAMLDFIGYGRPGNEFLSYGDDASLYPLDGKTSAFRRPSSYCGDGTVTTYNNAHSKPSDAAAVPPHEGGAPSYRPGEKKSKALDIIDPVTGEKLQLPAK